MFFVRFLISNLFSVAIIGIIVLLKKVLKNKLSLKFHYFMWFILLASLMVVFLPTSFFQNINMGSITQEITSPKNATHESTMVAPDMPDDWRYDFTELSNTSTVTVISTVLIAVWAIGAICVVGFYFLGIKKVRSIKRFAEPPSDDILCIFENCRTKLHVKKRVCLLQSDLVNSPVSFGCVFSYIVLPISITQNSCKTELEHILLHELTHIKHKDIWINFCFCAEQTVYWFNPIIWWAFSKMRLDREAYCDWAILNTYKNDEERLCYGDTLLRFANQKNNLTYIVASLFESKKQIKYRIEKIADFQKETTATKVLGRCFIVILTLAIMVQVPVFAAFASDFGLSYKPEHTMNTVPVDYSDYFGDTSGSAVLYDMKADVYKIYNPNAITKRIAPCSTCKIYSALNALEQGIITPASNTLQWDYLNRSVSSWNGNQNLSSAMKNSVNWYFQCLDAAAGAKQLQEFYTSIGYGNEYVGSNTAYYWNGSALKISPLEQVELLIKLYTNEFGFDEYNINAVKEALYLSENDNAKLYGKTGTGKVGSNDVSGWFIGYVETPNNVYFFAVNLQGHDHANGDVAAKITYSIFNTMGIKLE